MSLILPPSNLCYELPLHKFLENHELLAVSLIKMKDIIELSVAHTKSANGNLQNQETTLGN